MRRMFLHEGIRPDRNITTMTIDDVGHYSARKRKKIIASYPDHELEARTKGTPALWRGKNLSGARGDDCYASIANSRSHWPHVGGLDFGYDHPMAAVEIIWDRDTDTIFVSRTYRVKQASPIIHAAALRPWGKELRWAWPRDGNRETLEGAGIALAEQYRAQGLNMLHEFAHYLEGNGQKSVSVEAGLMDMLQRMESGRFKVFKHLNDWWEEFRLYHRKDGQVVKEGDDLMAATRYAVMMLRYASTQKSYQDFRRSLSYPKVTVA